MLKYFLHPFHFFLFSKNPYQNRIASNICDDFVPCFISIAWVHVFIAGMNFLEICGNVLRFCNIFLNISFLFSFIFILINIYNIDSEKCCLLIHFSYLKYSYNQWSNHKRYNEWDGYGHVIQQIIHTGFNTAIR